MKLSKQNQSRLEETKVEKIQEDEKYLRDHPEIGAALKVISKTLFQEQPDNAFKKIADIVLDKSFEEKVSEERSKMRKR